MMQGCVRLAVPEDAAWMSVLDEKTSLSPWSENAYVETILTHIVLVLELEEGRVGFAAGSIVLDEAEVLNIVVDPAQQGRGLGATLLSELLARLEKKGAQRCHLEVRRSNAPAISLYSKHGFVETGMRKAYYRTRDDREDAILYTATL